VSSNAGVSPPKADAAREPSAALPAGNARSQRTATLLDRPGSRIVRAFMICLPGRLDCYRVERTSSGPEVSAAEVQRPSRRSISTVDPRTTGECATTTHSQLLNLPPASHTSSPSVRPRQPGRVVLQHPRQLSSHASHPRGARYRHTREVLRPARMQQPSRRTCSGQVRAAMRLKYFPAHWVAGHLF